MLSGFSDALYNDWPKAYPNIIAIGATRSSLKEKKDKSQGQRFPFLVGQFSDLSYPEHHIIQLTHMMQFPLLQWTLEASQNIFTFPAFGGDIASELLSW